MRPECDQRESWLPSLKAPIPAVALIFPVTLFAASQHVGHANGVEILSLFVAELRRHLKAQRSAMPALERLAVHLVAEERLRMKHGCHVDGLVVIVCTFNFHIAGGQIRTDGPQEVSRSGATEIANYIPAFDAD